MHFVSSVEVPVNEGDTMVFLPSITLKQLVYCVCKEPILDKSSALTVFIISVLNRRESAVKAWWHISWPVWNRHILYLTFVCSITNKEYWFHSLLIFDFIFVRLLFCFCLCWCACLRVGGGGGYGCVFVLLIRKRLLHIMWLIPFCLVLIVSLGIAAPVQVSWNGKIISVVSKNLALFETKYRMIFWQTESTYCSANIYTISTFYTTIIVQVLRKAHISYQEFEA